MASAVLAALAGSPISREFHTKQRSPEKGNRFQSAVVAFGIITAGLVFLGYAINFS